MLLSRHCCNQEDHPVSFDLTAGTKKKIGRWINEDVALGC